MRLHPVIKLWGAILVVLLAYLLTGCGPSCDERGGEVVQDGWYYVWQLTDPAKGYGYWQAYPNYICKVKNNEH